MPEPFKTFFNPGTIAMIGANLAAHSPAFDRARFEALAGEGLEALELKARAAQITRALDACLPPDFGPACDLMLAALAPVGDSTTIDGQMMLVSASGDVIEFDDDDGPGLLPAFFVQNLPAGSYFIGVSGFDDIVFSDDPVGTDTLFDGLNNSGAPHGEVFQYKLSLAINVVPAPASATLLAFGGLVVSRRRRSSH